MQNLGSAPLPLLLDVFSVSVVRWWLRVINNIECGVL